MVAIRIADHVEHASSYDDGQKIFDLIAPAVLAGEQVQVSFAGIHAVPSAFINSAFLRLLEVTDFPRVQQTLRIVDSTKFINDLIRSRFAFVTGQTPTETA